MANSIALGAARLRMFFGQPPVLRFLAFTGVSGNRDGARAQFADAARLDLTPSEAIELKRMMMHG